MTLSRFAVVLACVLSFAAYGTALQASEPPTDTQSAAAKASAKEPATPAAKSAAVAKKAKKERRICKKVQPTGTRVSQRECRTESEWEEIQKAAGQATEKVQRDNLVITTQGGG